MMARPYILAHNDKWFVFVGCALIALCTTKSDALAIQREWIRRGHEWEGTSEPLPIVALTERTSVVAGNGSG